MLFGGMGGPIGIFFVGWTGLIMGCYSRHMRPGNLPAYIISLVGSGFICLFWLIPSPGGEVPLAAVFKSFDASALGGLFLLIFMGAQIAAAVLCFVTTRSKPSGEVADKSLRSLLLYLGSYAAVILGMFVSSLELITKEGGLTFIMAMLFLALKLVSMVGGMMLTVPIAGSCLLTRLMRR